MPTCHGRPVPCEGYGYPVCECACVGLCCPHVVLTPSQHNLNEIISRITNGHYAIIKIDSEELERWHRFIFEEAGATPQYLVGRMRGDYSSEHKFKCLGVDRCSVIGAATPSGDVSVDIAEVLNVLSRGLNIAEEILNSPYSIISSKRWMDVADNIYRFVEGFYKVMPFAGGNGRILEILERYAFCSLQMKTKPLDWGSQFLLFQENDNRDRVALNRPQLYLEILQRLPLSEK